MYVVYHWECVPEDYVAKFDTLQEAIDFRDEYDADDELLIGEVDH